MYIDNNQFTALRGAKCLFKISIFQQFPAICIYLLNIALIDFHAILCLALACQADSKT